MKSSNKIVISGLVSPRGIGDAIQYGNSVRLIKSLIPKASITLMCPYLKDNLSVFQGMNFDVSFLDSSFMGCMSIYRLLGARARSSKISPTDSPIAPTISRTTFKPLNTLYRKLNRYSPPINWHDKFTSLYMLRHLQFDAGIVGGHTCTLDLQDYIMKYDVIRSIINGPIVTSPISISGLALKEGTTLLNKKLIMSKLGSSLQKFEFVYVRGPYSLKILRDHLNIENVGMALDTGFGIRLTHPQSMPRKGKKRIVIIPRIDYFVTYNRREFYQLYLNTIATFISWAYENLDCEIFLSSQTINRESIDALLNVLRKRHFYSILKSLRIVIPKNIIEMCDLYGSSDIVISSYMHGGITALALGVPAFFIMPFTDLKLLDILAFLGLDTRSLAIDMFHRDSLNARNLIDKIEKITKNLKYYRKIINSAIDKKLITLEHPIRTLINLQNWEN